MVSADSGRRSGHKSSKTTSKATSNKAATKDATSAPATTPPATVGRLRKYLKPGEGREFNPEDRTTTEGRLINPSSPSWHVPDGRESWLSTTKRPTRSVGNLRRKDVGPFRAEDFATKASNDRDHSRTLEIPMPEQVINELQAIVDADVFPSRNVKALARTLIVEGVLTLHEIARHHGLMIPKSHLQLIDQICRINRNLQQTLGYDDAIEQSCDLIRTHRRCGYRNKARAALHELLATVKTIEIEEVRTRWERDLRAEFRDLMRGRPAARVHARKEAADGEGGDENEFELDESM